MNRDEFMELVYETFADEPDNVLANGIIEAADAYVEHEKAQLFREGITLDTISRQALCEYALNQKDKSVTPNDIMRFPSAKPKRTEKRMETHGVCLDAISRQAAIDAVDCINGVEEVLRSLPPAYSDENNQEFIKLTVRYSNGRPYYSIIYLEYDKNGVGHDFEGYSSYSLDVISDYLKKYFMPSAQPEPKVACWIKHETPDGGEQYECSRCGVLWEFNDGTPEDNEAYFCPKCGTKMKGEANE